MNIFFAWTSKKSQANLRLISLKVSGSFFCDVAGLKSTFKNRSKRLWLNAGSSGLDKEKGAGGMIFGRRSRAKIIREATFAAV
ncbi:MAG: hypothetical protein LBU64_10760 [Planctomycetota bacterium]|nr:hypothetical protein [Planctomycetota bacterium]